MEPATHITDDVYRRAAAIIKEASASFASASRLFPAETRRDVTLLYTWCRHCDDLTDGQELGRGRISTASFATLEELRADSHAALVGRPKPELPFLALAALSSRHSISPGLVDAHIQGFELDVQGWRPRTLDDTLAYCYHTAGTVGIMMAALMGMDDDVTLQRASDLGIAFQLTNIARDIREDALAGRSYLPKEWLQEAGLEIDDLTNRDQAARVLPLVEKLIDKAEPYYASAAIGIRALPRRSALAIAAARAAYRDIGHQILKRGPDALSERVFTSKGRKIWLMMTAAIGHVGNRSQRPGSSTPRIGLWTPPEVA
jgi:phytoene synthase